MGAEGLGAYKEYIAGMMAGLATVAVGHPFDTVKVLNSSIPIPINILHLWLSG